MSMRSLVYSGWLMVATGVAICAAVVVADVGGGVVLGLLMLVVLGGAGLFMVWLGQGWDEPLKSAQDLYKYGRPANAEVKKVEDSQLDAQGMRTAKLTVRVTPRNESAFKTTRRVALPGGRIPAVGETVSVKFDPNDRDEFVLLEETYEVRDSVQDAQAQMAAAAKMMSGFTKPPGS
jgi:hypothetical protein